MFLLFFRHSYSWYTETENTPYYTPEYPIFSHFHKITINVRNYNKSVVYLNIILTLWEGTEAVEHQGYESTVLHVWAADLYCSMASPVWKEQQVLPVTRSSHSITWPNQSQNSPCRSTVYIFKACTHANKNTVWGNLRDGKKGNLMTLISYFY